MVGDGNYPSRKPLSRKPPSRKPLANIACRWECVANVLDCWFAGVGWPCHRHDVKPGALSKQSVRFQKSDRRSCQLPLFLLIDGVGRVAFGCWPPGFDFYKNDRPALDCHEVEFANPRQVSPSNDLEAQLAQILGREIFAPLAQGLRLEPICQ